MSKLVLQSNFQSSQCFQPHSVDLHPVTVYLASLSPTSRSTMRQALDAIAQLLTQDKCDALALDWSQLRYQHTAAVRAVLMQQYAPATAKKMLVALRRVLKEAARLGQMSYEDYARATDLPRIDTPPQKLRGRALATTEISTLLAGSNEQTTIVFRDLALIAILRGSGIRRQELVQLKLRDYNPSTSELEIRSGKRSAYRTVYLPAIAINLIEAWLELRGRKPGALVCPIRKGGIIQLRHLSGDGVLKIVKKRAHLCGVSHFSPHDFRRTLASELLAAGVDTFVVQRILGHSSPLITAKYDLRGKHTMRQAVEQLFFPPN